MVISLRGVRLLGYGVYLLKGVMYVNFQSIYISRVTDGGIAEKDGKLKAGDRIISVSLLSLFIPLVKPRI